MTTQFRRHRSDHRPRTGLLLASSLISALVAFPSLAQSISGNAPAGTAPEQNASGNVFSGRPGYGQGPIPGRYPYQYFNQTPYRPHAYGGYGPTRSWSGAPGREARLARSMPKLVRDITDQGYRLTIQLAPNQNAEDIQVVPRGRGLLISSKTERLSRSEQQSQDGSGYRRSFSFSSGGFQRRIGVPPDADLSAMSRTNDDNAVVLILPRR